MLAICFSDEDVPPAGVVYRSFSLFAKAYEPAGRGFHDAVALQCGLEAPAGEAEPAAEIDMEKMRGKRRRLTGVGKEDFYEVLELHEERATIGEARIREAYKKLVLLYHPDKYGDQAGYTLEAKEKWLKVA